MSQRDPSQRSSPKTWMGYAIGAACLVWVFHDTAPGEIFSQFEGLQWWLVALAVLADIGSYWAQGFRWALLLRPIAPFSTFKATQAIYAGLFTNEVIPMRVGELLRVWVASRWLSIPIATVASSVGLERFLDGLWLALTAGLLVLLVPVPAYLLGAEELLAGVVLAGTLVFVFILLRAQPRQRVQPQHRGLGRLRPLIDHLAGALHAMGRSPSFYAAILVSGVYLGFQILAFWLVMEAYGIHLSLLHGAAVVLILHLGTMIPGPPSNVGTYQFFVIAGLSQFGVDKATATGFSVVVFLILTIPLWVIGLFAFSGAGFNPWHVRTEAMAIWRKVSQSGR